MRGGAYCGPWHSCYLILQRKGADCGIASSVITALCGQNANRQSEHERGGGDDYAFGHGGSPLSFYVHVACIAVYSTAACDGRHKLGEYGELPPAAVPPAPAARQGVQDQRLPTQIRKSAPRLSTKKPRHPPPALRERRHRGLARRRVAVRRRAVLVVPEREPHIQDIPTGITAAFMIRPSYRAPSIGST
jgi:hypothetical protein